MARELKVGQLVYVPRVRIGMVQDDCTPFYRTQIDSISAGSIKITDDNNTTHKVAKSLVHKDIGVVIIKIGDFDSEDTLLDPLTKSVLQFTRVLVGDGHVRRLEVRSKAELKKLWSVNHKAQSHVVVIGHAATNHFYFGVDEECSADDFGKMFYIPNMMPKSFILLACHAGHLGFSRELSRSRAVSSLIACSKSVHGAVSSVFCQSVLTNNLLNGRTTKVAFTDAYKSYPKNYFRFWQNGNLEAGHDARNRQN